MAHPNEELLRRGYDAFTKGDMEAVNELFADDIVWHNAGRDQFAGDYHGKDEVFGFLAQLITFTEGTYEQEVHDIVANDEHAIALVEFRARKGDDSLIGRGVQVWHVKDGKAVEFWGVAQDPYRDEEFFGPKA